jgi:chromosome partitioning protein
MPGQLTNQIAGIAGSVQLIVQPTSPSVDDLHPSMLVFQALQRVRIPRDRPAFALCRVLGEKEAEATRDYLEKEGYTVLARRHLRAPSLSRCASISAGR